MTNKNNNKTTNSTEKLKKCYQCEKLKLEREFHVCNSREDKLQLYCKPCNNNTKYTGELSVILVEVDGDQVECKKCNTCKEIKSLSAFHSNGMQRGKYSRRGSCGQCENEKKVKSKAIKKALRQAKKLA
ncbi:MULTISPECIES: hypothetical protein [Bacillus cereus group]|uniref:hypothetical protein n=1 Tax=Bacillus cereus group TaxID=86661 RepID=UPI00032D98E2|nr:MULTISPECIES: hypothetical protein [Bacillus cereus group]EOP24242.1 hypothetical protein IG5_03709 [Bacillus toyonensis]PEK38088.1 hypothetical protein CN897_03690 [Bacillus toyonensis]PEL75108.1 hypothetical protein CN603_13530 [Bacillus toyonensis]PGB44905.1 hypothetical protein COM02_15825 [Bacillus toyonensis]